MNRKLVKKLVLAVVLLAMIPILFYLLGSPKTKRKNIEYINRLVALEKFESEAQLENSVNEDELSQGCFYVDLNNRTDLITAIESKGEPLDSALTIVSAINEGIQYINLIIEDISLVDNEKYFELNKSALSGIYGVSNLKEFNELMGIFNKCTPLQTYSVNIDSIKIKQKSYYFDLIINDSLTIPLCIMIKDSYSMQYSSYWNFKYK